MFNFIPFSGKMKISKRLPKLQLLLKQIWESWNDCCLPAITRYSIARPDFDAMMNQIRWSSRKLLLESVIKDACSPLLKKHLKIRR